MEIVLQYTALVEVCALSVLSIMPVKIQKKTSALSWPQITSTTPHKVKNSVLKLLLPKTNNKPKNPRPKFE